MTDLYRLFPKEMEKLVVDLGYRRYRADQILLPLYYKFPKNVSEIKQLPKEMREKLIESGYTIGSTKEVHRVVSDDGDTMKLLLNLADGTPGQDGLRQVGVDTSYGGLRATASDLGETDASARFVENHKKNPTAEISVHGQEPTKRPPCR